MIRPVRSTMLFAGILALSFAQQSYAQLEDKIALLKAPKGFEISLFAEGVVNARQMAVGDKGTVFVGTRGANTILASLNTPLAIVLTKLAAGSRTWMR